MDQMSQTIHFSHCWLCDTGGKEPITDTPSKERELTAMVAGGARRPRAVYSMEE